MKYHSPVRMNSALVLGFCLGLTGCAQAPSEAPPAAPVTVTVSYPVERDVTDYAEFTARIAAVDSVEVRAHVWGYLEKVNFKEGTLVKKGDVLFELDPRCYQADYDRAVANLAQAKAHLARLGRFQRARTLIRSAAIAKADYDLALGDRNEAAAMVGVAEAALNTARLNLGYTKVTAPVSGRISRYMVTVGNLIQSADLANVTLLTTIVSVDPMYAYFDVDEHTVLHVRQSIREGKAKSARDRVPVRSLGLANEEGFPHQGTIDFVDNQVNPKTGTLRRPGHVLQHRTRRSSPASSPASACPSAHPTRRCWSATARSTPTRAERSSTSSTTRTRSSPAPFGPDRCTTACGRSRTA